MLWLEKLSTLTPIETAFWGSSAVIGIPLIANFLKEIYFDRRKQKVERAYIGVQLIFLLENFAAKCVDVSWDKGYPLDCPKPEPKDYKTQVETPVFDTSSVKGEHKFLKPDLLYEIQNIHNEIHKTKQDLNEWLDINGWAGIEHRRYFTKRRELYLDIAALAIDISDSLRKEFKVKQADGLGIHKKIRDSKKHLKQEHEIRLQRIKERKAERAAKQAAEQSAK